MLIAPPNVHALAVALLEAIGVPGPCGQITLNVNEGRVQSIETKIHLRMPVAVDKAQKVA